MISAAISYIVEHSLASMVIPRKLASWDMTVVRSLPWALGYLAQHHMQAMLSYQVKTILLVVNLMIELHVVIVQLILISKDCTMAHLLQIILAVVITSYQLHYQAAL